VGISRVWYREFNPDACFTKSGRPSNVLLSQQCKRRLMTDTKRQPAWYSTKTNKQTHGISFLSAHVRYSSNHLGINYIHECQQTFKEHASGYICISCPLKQTGVHKVEEKKKVMRVILNVRPASVPLVPWVRRSSVLYDEIRDREFNRLRNSETLHVKSTHTQHPLLRSPEPHFPSEKLEITSIAHWCHNTTQWVSWR